MLKLLGAVLVFGACAALGLSARQELRRRVAAADAMLLALSLLTSEISCRRATIPELTALLAENENETVRALFQYLQRLLRERNGLSLSYLWRKAVREQGPTLGLGQEECEILCSAADYLGRYDAQEQTLGLQQVSRRLAAARETAAGELESKGSLYRTCGIALGLLVILVLV